MIPIILITYYIILFMCRVLVIQNEMSIIIDLCISGLEIFLLFHFVYKHTYKKSFKKATHVKVVVFCRKVSTFLLIVICVPTHTKNMIFLLKFRAEKK